MIRALLEGYTPADTREAGFVPAFLRLPMPAARARSHFEPGHVTASAFILSPNRADLLLIEHSKLARWLQPGGHVDPEDLDLEQAARREALEETGLGQLELLAAPFDLDIHQIPARKAEPDHWHFDVRFLFRSPTRDFQAGSDALAARWVPLDEVADIKTDDSVRRVLAKL